MTTTPLSENSLVLFDFSETLSTASTRTERALKRWFGGVVFWLGINQKVISYLYSFVFLEGLIVFICHCSLF
jgi:hypothetical protein